MPEISEEFFQRSQFLDTLERYEWKVALDHLVSFSAHCHYLFGSIIRNGDPEWVLAALQLWARLFTRAQKTCAKIHWQCTDGRYYTSWARTKICMYIYLPPFCYEQVHELRERDDRILRKRRLMKSLGRRSLTAPLIQPLWVDNASIPGLLCVLQGIIYRRESRTRSRRNRAKNRMWTKRR